MTETTIRTVITGRVQGVGYRAFVEAQAARRGLKGWVRNRRDGSVEAVFSGPQHVVDGMLAACNEGPGSSRVDDVEVEPADTDVDGFRVLPTM
ncbi:MAG TPA: acylphosphatase [Hyphomonadaceae bacterium]|jgi:acylphosphatase|nr:acylphosphatase [Hyphomonadaceae bacterium]